MDDLAEVSVNAVITTAIRRCGIPEGNITPLMLEYGKTNLRYVLNDLSMQGTPLWAVENLTIGFNQGQVSYSLPAKIKEIVYANWRQTTPLQYTCTGGVDPTNLNAWNYYKYASTTTSFLATCDKVSNIGSIGLFFYGNQNLTLTIEVSRDNLTWMPVYFDSLQTTYLDGKWLWVDLNPSFQGYYVRVSCANGEVLSLRALYITDLSSMTEIPMQRMNQETYGSYVNKRSFGTPLAYYLDKQIIPKLYIWQEATDIFNWQMTIRTKQVITQELKLSSSLEIPKWFEESVMWRTAERLFLDLPSDQVRMDNLQIIQNNSLKSTKLATMDQADESPTMIFSNFGCYTR